MHIQRISPADIAAHMQLSEAELWSFARNMDKWFKPTRLERVAGKERPIDAPYKGPKKTFKRLHRWFQSAKLFHPVAHGGIKGKSCFSSARRHLGKKYVWIRDASNCYPSVSPIAFQAELKQLGFRHDTAVLLTMLCTVRGYIPQGSPVSGDAINLFFWRIDQATASYCGWNGLSASRVADDFVLSGNHKSRGDVAIRRIEEAIEARGITVNDKKRRKAGFQTRLAAQHVHSIRVDNRRGTRLSREHRTVATKLANSYVDACRRVQPDSLEAIAAKRQRLYGYLYYAGQATVSPAHHLRRQLAVGDCMIARKLRELQITADKNKWWLNNRYRNEPLRIARIWRMRISTDVQALSLK